MREHPARFPSPLIKPDMWISHIRLSDWLRGTPTEADSALRRRATAPKNCHLRVALQLMERSRNCCGVLDSSSIAAPFTPAQAHQKQGPFPPPALPGIDGTVTLSDFRVGRHPSTTLEMRSPPAPDLPQLLRSPSLHAVPSTPVDRTGACRFLPHSRGLPRLTGGSASTTSLSRPAQASLALRPARSQPTQRRTLVPRLRPAQSPDQIAR